MEGEVSQAEQLSLLSSQAVFCFPISLLLKGRNFQGQATFRQLAHARIMFKCLNIEK